MFNSVSVMVHLLLPGAWGGLVWCGAGAGLSCPSGLFAFGPDSLNKNSAPGANQLLGDRYSRKLVYPVEVRGVPKKKVIYLLLKCGPFLLPSPLGWILGNCR